MLIFAAIAGAFFLVMVAGFLLGHDSDHDHSGFDHDHSGEATVSIFSMKVLATFGMGFGAGGAIAAYYGHDTLYASMAGVLCGAILAGCMYFFLHVISTQQASSLIETATLIGRSGAVTLSIEKGSLGEVTLDCGGANTVFTARSNDESPIQKGRAVKVIRAAGSTLVVEEIKN